VADREAPPIGALFWAKRTFGYGGQQLDRGQVFKIKGLPNDALLWDLGYVVSVGEGAPTFPCRGCGAEFIDMGMRDGHGKTRHESREFIPPSPPRRASEESKDAYQNRLDEWAKQAGAMADAQGDRQSKLEDEVAPLDLTKTAATRA
jgi:hypothetical protein